MKKKFTSKKKVVRAGVLAAALFVASLVAYLGWSPGATVTDGRHDRGENGIWISHGWLGDDNWFERYGRDPGQFRDAGAMATLERKLADHHVTDVFPHLCPSSPGGAIAAHDPVQMENFLDAMESFRVMPWVGGVNGVHCFLDSSTWRNNFTLSISRLLTAHPRLAGIHLNIEPMPSGTQDYLALLDEIRAAMPQGKILSVAAYPPVSIMQPVPEVHWGEGFFKAVAGKADQLAVMMYDTALPLEKPYVHLMESWTQKVLAWGAITDVLLGVPVYDDKGVLYHHPRVENLENALSGIHAGLGALGTLPDGYQGVALYCQWEMDPMEWAYLKKHFLFSENIYEASL